MGKIFSVQNCDNWTDLEPLSQIQNGINTLAIFHIGTQVSLGGFPSIMGMRHLSIDSSSLNSLRGMRVFKPLTSALFHCSELISLNGLENAPNLEKISLYTPNLSDWRALGNLHHLRKLNIETSCGDYNGLVYAQSLERLEIANAKTFKNFRLQAGGFDSLPNLKSLYLSNNDGLSLNGLAEFAPNIEELHIWEPSLSKEYVMHFFEEAKSKGQLQQLRALEVSAQHFSKAES